MVEKMEVDGGSGGWWRKWRVVEKVEEVEGGGGSGGWLEKWRK